MSINLGLSDKQFELRPSLTMMQEDESSNLRPSTYSVYKSRLSLPLPKNLPILSILESLHSYVNSDAASGAVKRRNVEAERLLGNAFNQHQVTVLQQIIEQSVLQESPTYFSAIVIVYSFALVLTSNLTVCCRNRGDPSSPYRRYKY